MDDSLKNLHEETFAAGQKAAAKKYLAELFEEETELAKRAGEVASEMIDLANEIASDGNPHKEQVAKILQDGLVKALQAMQHVGDGAITSEERKVAVEQARPFSEGSQSSKTHLPNGPESSSEIKALEHNMAPEPKSKRGRPPGSKNRPKPTQAD